MLFSFVVVFVCLGLSVAILAQTGFSLMFPLVVLSLAGMAAPLLDWTSEASTGDVDIQPDPVATGGTRSQVGGQAN